MVQPAKSAKLQLLQGNPNKRKVSELEQRAKNEEKLKIKNDNIVAPKWLDKTGKEVFEQIKLELINIDLISNVDVYHMAMFSDSYSKYLKMNRRINRDGLVIDGKPHPLLSRLEKQASQVRTFGTDLGLSPSARAKLAIKLSEDDSSDDDDF